MEISNNINNPSKWQDTFGRHPLRAGAINNIKEQNVINILLTLRHALAHGNVVYLNEDGNEAPGRRVTHLAFVSKGLIGSASYRVLIVEENAFVDFLKAWANWLSKFNMDSTLRRAA